MRTLLSLTLRPTIWRTMEGAGRERTANLVQLVVTHSVSIFEQRAETLRIGDGTKIARHRSVQRKFETIYQEWKQLIKEPWKDRGGLERFEYGPG